MENQHDDQAGTDPRHTSAPILGIDRRTPLMRVDLTINVPTILSIFGLISAVSAWGINVYSDLDKRQLRTDIAVVEIRGRLDKAESAMSSIKTDSGVQQQLLRSDMKAEMGEIKSMLNQIIFGGAGIPPARRPTQQQLDEWRK